MIPERFMRYPKWVKTIILFVHLALVFPFAIVWYFAVSIKDAVIEVAQELFAAIKMLPSDCYDFIKYQSINEKRKIQWAKDEDEEL